MASMSWRVLLVPEGGIVTTSLTLCSNWKHCKCWSSSCLDRVIDDLSCQATSDLGMMCHGIPGSRGRVVTCCWSIPPQQRPCIFASAVCDIWLAPQWPGQSVHVPLRLSRQRISFTINSSPLIPIRYQHHQCLTLQVRQPAIVPKYADGSEFTMISIAPYLREQ